MTAGPYARIRHPMYSAILGWLISLGLVGATWAPFAFAALGTLIVLLRIQGEEKMMVGQFGDGYREYMRRTGRLLPTIRGLRPAEKIQHNTCMKAKCEHLPALKPSLVLGLVVSCTTLSALAACVFWAGGSMRPARGLSGAVGFISGLIGSGVAFWFSVRERDRMVALAALFSVLPVGFWCWQIVQIIHT